MFWLTWLTKMRRIFLTVKNDKNHQSSKLFGQQSTDIRVFLHINVVLKIEKFFLCVFDKFCLQMSMSSKQSLFTQIHEKLTGKKKTVLIMPGQQMALSNCKVMLCACAHNQTEEIVFMHTTSQFSQHFFQFTQTITILFSKTF